MANPWDNDPIKTPAQAAPWEADPIKRPRSPAGHPSFEEGQALLNAEEQQQRMQGASGTIGATLTGVADGVPIAGPALLGAGQRGAAIASTVMNGGTYDENLKQAQDITQQAQDAHPWLTTGANVAGAVGGTIPMMAAAPAAFGIGTASTPVAMAAGGATGLAMGATDAGVRSDWDPQKMAVGGGIGLLVGGASPFIAQKAGNVVRSLMNGRAQNAAAHEAGTSREAVNVVARSLAADDAVAATNKNIQAAGPNAMLADAGPSTLSVLDTAIQRGGPQAGRAAQRINARAEAATQEINSALDAGLGPSEGIVAPLNALRRSTQPARSAAYDAAYKKPIDYADPRGRLLEKIVKERVPASAINKANELMRVNGERSQQILAKIGDDGSVTLETLPDVRQIDYITRGLKAVADEADGMGKLGGTTDLGRAYGNLSTEIRNITKALVPEYKTALDTAATPIAAKQAREFGQKMLSPAIARDEAEEYITSLSAAELKSLKGGIRGDVAEKLSNVKRTLSDPNVDARQGIAALRELSSDAVREKMTMVMGKNEADAMFRAIDQAGRSFDLRAGVTANSKTYARQAAERAVDAATQPGVIETAASGRPLRAAQGFLQTLMGTGPEAQLARQDAAWGEIANLLTQPANQGGGTFLQALQGAAQRIPTADRQAANIIRAVTRGGGVSSIPTSRLLQE